MRGYVKTMEIISDIMERSDEMMPDIFRKLNICEKRLLKEQPRHTFSKNDCRNVMKQYEMPRLTENRLGIISECLLLLYNWYKSKIIYNIEQEAVNTNIKMDREKVKMFPYSGIYLDLEFYSLKYLGCFASLIREKKEFSLVRYILLGFIEYDKDVDMYGIGPFMLEVSDGISIEDAFLECFYDSMSPYQNMERNIEASNWAMSNLYILIDNINSRKDLKQAASVKRNVVVQTLELVNDKTYRLTKAPKYRYENGRNAGKGSKKSPHVRRTHNRYYAIKDEVGNLIGEKVITIKEMRIHAEEENIITIKLLPEEDL